MPKVKPLARQSSPIGTLIYIQKGVEDKSEQGTYNVIRHHSNMSDVAQEYLMNESNSLSFSSRKNKTIDLTEYYRLSYQYKNDCLSASIEYDKEYYSDRDIKPNESLFFKLTIIPFNKKKNFDL